MTLKIDIPPELEARLKREALQHGVAEEEYARQLIDKNLAPAPACDQATLDLLAQWKAESHRASVEEIEQAKKEWEEFKKSMNENSMSGRLIYPS